MAARILLVLLLLTTFLRADDEATWSKPVKGLRARLVIPAHQDLSSDRILRVCLELQNTQNTLGNRKIYYQAGSLSIQCTDEAGHAPPGQGVAYDDIEPVADPSQPLILPFGGTLRFPINHHGASYGDTTRVVLDLPGGVASILSSDHHTYFISGTLTIPPKAGDGSFMTWNGTLDLPKIPVP